MLRTLQEEAERRGSRVDRCVADIGALPLRSGAVDLAIAGHVLYHLNGIGRGARELARVVRPDGWVLATTNSDAIDPLVIDLHERALAALDIPFVPESPSRFSLENGRDCLASACGVVAVHTFADSVTYPDVATFVDGYVTIGHYRLLIEDEAVTLPKRRCLADEVGRQAARRLEATGALRSPVLMGAFVCRDPVR